MVGRYKVITLCGSTRFKDAFIEAQKRLTLEAQYHSPKANAVEKGLAEAGLFSVKARGRDA